MGYQYQVFGFDLNVFSHDGKAGFIRDVHQALLNPLRFIENYTLKPVPEEWEGYLCHIFGEESVNTARDYEQRLLSVRNRSSRDLAYLKRYLLMQIQGDMHRNVQDQCAGYALLEDFDPRHRDDHCYELVIEREGGRETKSKAYMLASPQTHSDRETLFAEMASKSGPDTVDDKQRRFKIISDLTESAVQVYHKAQGLVEIGVVQTPNLSVILITDPYESADGRTVPPEAILIENNKKGRLQDELLGKPKDSCYNPQDGPFSELYAQHGKSLLYIQERKSHKNDLISGVEQLLPGESCCDTQQQEDRIDQRVLSLAGKSDGRI